MLPNTGQAGKLIITRLVLNLEGKHMNKYVYDFKQQSTNLQLIGMIDGSTIRDVRVALKFIYLDRQIQIETDYHSGKISGLLRYYKMQAVLYQTYIAKLKTCESKEARSKNTLRNEDIDL